MNSSAHNLPDESRPPAETVPSITSMSTGVAPRARITYRTRLATSEADIHAAQRLRFEVFNVELQEGLNESWRTRLDSDRFDATCDHLVIEHIGTGKIVGTYRLQTGDMAAAANGYDSEQEFDFAPFEPFRSEIVELGRACVHQDHRKGNVLDLLWRGIAAYTRERKARYLLGAARSPRRSRARPRDVCAARAGIPCPGAIPHLAAPRLRAARRRAARRLPRPPRLLRTYLSVGSKSAANPLSTANLGPSIS